MQPYLTPTSTRNYIVKYLSAIIVHSLSRYVRSEISAIFGLIPINLSIFQNFLLETKTESKADLKSIKWKFSIIFFSLVFSIIWITINVASVVRRHALNLYCVSFRVFSIFSFIRFISTQRKILRIESEVITVVL